MSTNFGIGDLVRVNSSNHPHWHGKKGVIERNGVSSADGTHGFIVAVRNEDGSEALLDLLTIQMVKIVKDPVLTRLINDIEQQSGLTKPTANEYNAQQVGVEQDRAEREVNIFRMGTAEGYINGFREGYLSGYQTACEEIRALHEKYGINKTGEDDASLTE